MDNPEKQHWFACVFVWWYGGWKRRTGRKPQNCCKSL